MIKKGSKENPIEYGSLRNPPFIKAQSTTGERVYTSTGHHLQFLRPGLAPQGNIGLSRANKNESFGRFNYYKLILRQFFALIRAGRPKQLG